MTAPRDDRDTKNERPRRASSTGMTAWGLVDAWLAGDVLRRVFRRAGPHGPEMGAGDGVHATVWEPERPGEDPSQAALRAIGSLPA